MKKQTAVEWLVDELRNQIEKGTLNAIAISELKMKAKAMEKEQILKGHASGYNDGCRYMNYIKQDFKHAEAYYDHKYK
jgi:hypothetical protein